MLGTESVLSTLRPMPVQLDTRPHWIENMQARQLGLQDGQVVQATVEEKDGRVRLWLKDFSFDLPNGWVLKDGDKPFLRVLVNPSGWGFLIQNPSEAVAAQAKFNITSAQGADKAHPDGVGLGGSTAGLAEEVLSPSATTNRLNTLGLGFSSWSLSTKSSSVSSLSSSW